MLKLGKFLQIALLVALAGGVGPAYSAFWQWSKTANNNAGFDPTINWSEGMSPSSINDSGRAMMARAAEYRDDISGALTTGGSSTAYTLTTNQATGGNGFCPSAAVPADGTMVAFRAHATNGTAATFTIDSCLPYPLQTSAAVAAGAGTIVLGTPYRISFNLAQLSWVLEAGYGNPYSVPLGGLLPSTLAAPPNSNFILPAGQCISNVTYAAYWVALGSPASGGCAGGQFAVIDVRGRAAVALDNLNGTAANRLTSSSTGCGTAMTSIGAACANGNETVLVGIPNLPPFTPSGSVSNGGITINGGTVLRAVAGDNNNNGGGGGVFSAMAGVVTLTASQGASSFTGTPQGGTSTGLVNVMPVVAVSYFLRVI